MGLIAFTRFAVLLALVVSGVTSAPARAQDTTGAGAIAGVVRNSGGQPAEGVRVCVLGSPSCATTDLQGLFRIEGLRAGTYQLELVPRAGGSGDLPFVTDPVVVRAGRAGALEVTLPTSSTLQQTVSVTAPAFSAPEEVKNSAFLIQPLEILKSAGALQDVSRYVQTLPGAVIGTSDFRNDIIVRGGSPLENLFIVDNVEIPNINAFANFASAGGTVNILDAGLIEDVTFLTGGYPAPYINRTSSVLQVTQREGRRDGFRAWTTLGFAGAGTILEGPIGRNRKSPSSATSPRGASITASPKGASINTSPRGASINTSPRGSWIVSARRSFLDLFTDDIGIGGVPILYTLNGKALYDLTPRDRVWLVNITGIDEIRLGAREGETTGGDDNEELFNFDIRYNGWRSATGLNWQRLFGSRAVGLLGVTHSEAKVGTQVKDLIQNGVPPPGTPIDDVIANSPTVFFENSREGETTIKYDLTFYGPLRTKMQAGGSFKIFRIKYDVDSPDGSDIPYSLDPSADIFSLNTRFSAYQTGAYIQATTDVTSRLDVTVGVRLDHYEALDDVRFSPRLGLGYRLTDRLTWTAGYGAYYQQPYFLFLAAFPENRVLDPWRADHLVTGVAWQPSATWRLTLEAYWKDYEKYPVATEYPSLSLANIGDTFNVREALFPLTSAGEGYSQGVELFVQRRFTGGLYGQGNLALSKTRHAGLDAVLRPGAFDYPVVFNLAGGYRLSRTWDVSTRVAWLSGRPYSPFDEQTSAAQRRAVYDLSRINALRAPDYFRLDVRVDRTFIVGGEPFVLFGGVQNVTNRRNFAGYQWNRGTNAQEFTEQQGLFPILGFEWKF